MSAGTTSRWGRALATALLLTALAPPGLSVSGGASASAEETSKGIQRGHKGSRSDLGQDQSEDLRARWEGKSPEERRLLLERYRELQAMTREARERLHERARRLRELERVLRGRLTEPERRALDRLAPPEAAARWRERLHDHLRERGRSMRERLPEGVRRRLESLPPGERARFLDGLRERRREERSRRAIHHLGRRLGLPVEEIRAHAALPLGERLEVLLGLERRHLERRVEERGLPRGLGEEEWERMRELSDETFLRALRPYLPPRVRGGRVPGAGPFPGRSSRRF